MHVDTRTRRIIALGVFALVVVAALMAPGAAFATPGDGPDSAIALPAFPFAAVPGTLTTDPSDTSYHSFWYTTHLSAGQTIEVAATMPGLEPHQIFAISSNFTDPMTIGSDPAGTGVERLIYMAPHTDDYFIAIYADTNAPFLLDGSVIAPLNYKLSNLTAPKRVKHKRAFTVSAALNGEWDSSVVPVRFEVQRKAGRKWKAAGSTTGKLAGSSLSFTKFSASLKITKKGSYRVRARYQDAAHPGVAYDKWKSVTIY